MYKLMYICPVVSRQSFCQCMEKLLALIEREDAGAFTFHSCISVMDKVNIKELENINIDRTPLRIHTEFEVI